jgi:uncharacterized membrane protein
VKLSKRVKNCEPIKLNATVDDGETRRLCQKGKRMKTSLIIGILMIVLGVVAFAYQGIGYTKREKIIDIGPIQATAETQKTLPIPPLVAGAVLIGGIALIFVGTRH